jgi:hypothetical protein
MAKFPVEYTDQEGVVDAVNYLLSGPAGLGQNFAGFTSPVNSSNDPSTNDPAYLTGNFRPPFTNSDSATNLYVAPIALNYGQYLDSRTIKFVFAEEQAAPPFALGNPVTVKNMLPLLQAGKSNDSQYNGSYTQGGVTECTTTYCIVRINGNGTVYANGYGGTVEYEGLSDLALVSTDCNAKVTVNGAEDRVFISGQLNTFLTYTATADTTFQYSVQINRYSGTPNNDPVNPEYTFNYDATVAVKTYNIRVKAGTGTLPPNESSWLVNAQPIETIFTAIIDEPPVGYFWYILELELAKTAENVVINQCQFGNRSLSTQVVKQ